MCKPNITMLGAGSGFVISIAKELAPSKVLQGATFTLMDVDAGRLEKAEAEVRKIFDVKTSKVRLRSTTSLEESLDGCDYVIASCEINRYPFWIKDLTIPERHGVYQVMGENGGPGGQIHAMRNISLFMDITAAMEKYCPDAWLMNFTNPMSYLCTYFKNYAKNPALGFCHQVHGTFGVIAEMLGMEPGELEVITGGVNHFNWLVDIRRRGTSESFMEEFLSLVRKSKYWKEHYERIPRQDFTLEVLETFGAYPVGYDDHISEYIPFFYEKEEWAEKGLESLEGRLREGMAAGDEAKSLEAVTLDGAWVRKPPFPRDPDHPYYPEKPCAVIEALETNTPTYLDAINIRNNNCIPNLPADAIVDVPALVIGGAVRGVYVGELPIGCMELCRRQITLHEMVARATVEGDEKLAVQALCLDPYVRSITQAKKIWADFKKEYIDYLPTFAK